MNIRRCAIQLCLLTAAVLLPLAGGAQTVTQISEGEYHSLFLKSDGTMWAMGDNMYGALGDGTLNPATRPEFITNNVAAVTARGYFSVFLKRDGSVWSMGNSPAQYSNGAYYATNIPVLLLASNVTTIAAGYGFILAIKKDGSLWAVGEQDTGALGTGTYVPARTNQFQMVLSNNVAAIACGEFHSLVLKNDGSLWGMGYNNSGQLGLGALSQTNLPALIVASNVVAISAGLADSLFLKRDGSLWGMGINYFGELGDGSSNETNSPELIVPNSVTAIAAGQTSSLFIKNDGTLWGMGWNYYGMLGDGTYNNTNRAEMITTNAAGIVSGDYHNLLIKTDGSLWATGDDYFGELGDGGTFNYVNRFEQILAAPPSYNISPKILLGGDLQLSFAGITGTNYALDRTFSLPPVNWVPQETNPAGTGGVVLFTNTPNPASNNFWRVRSVP